MWHGNELRILWEGRTVGIPVTNENVQQHLKMVHKIARKLHGKIGDNAISYDDLFSEGCIGLIKALESFDPTTGYQFSTYAYPTIKGCIHNFLDRKGSPIRFPDHAPRWANRILKAGLQDELPTVISEKLGCDTFYIDQAFEYMRMRNLYSLDMPRKDAKNQGGDSDEDHSFLANTEDDISHIMVEDFLNQLNPQKREIVTLIMQGYNSREIGAHLGCSHQNVRRHLKSIREQYTHYQRSNVLPFKQKEEESMPAPEQLTKEFVESEFAKGKSAAQIERELGMKVNSIFYYLKRWGLKSSHSPVGGKRENAETPKAGEPAVAKITAGEVVIPLPAASQPCRQRRAIHLEITGEQHEIEAELAAILAYVTTTKGKQFVLELQLSEVASV